MLSRVWLFTTPWSIAQQAPLSMGFSQQEYWSRVPFPSPGIKPRLLAVEAQSPNHWTAREVPKINHFKVYNSVALNTSPLSISKMFSSPQTKPSYSVRSHFPLAPSLQPQATINLLLVSMDLPIPDISYEWNYIICGLLSLASFT